MRFSRFFLAAGLLAVAAPACVRAQSPENSDSSRAPAIVVPSGIHGNGGLPAADGATSPAVAELMQFKPSDVKFNVGDLMDILRDRRHEGWVLAAYPDPKTNRPLIGAGFSLDLPAREHLQTDPLNPHLFLEPSSAELWQAAGLEPARLDGILSEYSQRMDTWTIRQFRKQLRSLPAQISDEEANGLLRVAIIQSIYNARAYCRHFDELSASQQMAMSQLVYQMGVNLAEFTQFLGLINREEISEARSADAQYWHTVQLSLTQSQWARLYRARAVAVIAMLNPSYDENPPGAERKVSAVLHPPAHNGRASRSASRRTARYKTSHTSKSHHARPRTRKE